MSEFKNLRLFNGKEGQIAMVDYSLVNESVENVSFTGSHPDGKDMVIYLPNRFHQKFIEAIDTAPVRNFNCTVKSLQNTVTNNYKIGRPSNKSGNIEMTPFHPKLFSHLKVYENEDDEEIFVFINQLEGYSTVNKGNRIKLYQADMENLVGASYGSEEFGIKTSFLQRINLFIDSSIGEDIEEELVKCFKSVTLFENQYVVKDFVENLFGRVITSTIQPFTKVFQMNPEAEVEAVFCSGESKVLARTKGRFQFDGYSKDEKGTLIIFGSNIKSLEKDEFTLPIISRSYSILYMEKLLRVFHLVSNLPSDRSMYRALLEGNKDLVFDYLLGTNQKLDEEDKMNCVFNKIFLKCWEQFISFLENLRLSDEAMTPPFHAQNREIPYGLGQVSSVPFHRGFSGLSRYP